jgi:hypothetical protein
MYTERRDEGCDDAVDVSRWDAIRVEFVWAALSDDGDETFKVMVGAEL